jgi:hypothetical protein
MMKLLPPNRVARWYIFKPKFQIWVNFGGSCNRRGWYVLYPFGIFYSHLVFVVAIWYILHPFGIFFPFWYVVARRIWQPYHPIKFGGSSNNASTRTILNGVAKLYIFILRSQYWYILKGLGMENSVFCMTI